MNSGQNQGFRDREVIWNELDSAIFFENLIAIFIVFLRL